jgi:hypothetical protein
MMKSLIVQNNTIDTVPPITIPTHPRKRELVGQWITVDGKLTWKWNIKRS